MVEELIRARIVFDDSGIGKYAGKGGDKLPSGGGGPGIAKIAAGVVAGLGLASLLKKGFDAMMEASGALQSSINILTKSIVLFLKPIADIVGLIIRPFALQMLRYGVAFYKWAMQNKVFKSLVSSEKPETAGEKAGDLTAKIGGGAVIGGAIGVGVGGPAGGVIGAAIGSVIAMIKEAWEGAKKLFWQFPIEIGIIVWEGLQDLWKKIVPAFQEAWTNILSYAQAVWDNITGFFTSTLPAYWTGFTAFISSIPALLSNIFLLVFTQLTDSFTKTWEGLKLFLVETLPVALKTAWESLKIFFTDTIPGWLTSGWDSIKLFFTETIPGWFTTLGDKLIAWWDSIKSKFEIKLPWTQTQTTQKTTKVQDALITKTGQVIQMNPQDNVMAFKGKGPSGGTNNITVNVNALDAKSIDRSTLNQIVKAIEQSMNRGFASRSTEMIGI